MENRITENRRIRPRFSIRTCLLLFAIIAMGLGWLVTERAYDKLANKFKEQIQIQTYLNGELGYFDVEDESFHYIRELENQVPFARRYRVCFPRGDYNICVGDYLGGEFTPENLKKRRQFKILLKMTSNMSLHVFNEKQVGALLPTAVAGLSVKTLDLTSGELYGGSLSDYKVSVEELNSPDGQHKPARTWRVGIEKPHGELMTYPGGTKFIPLFILKEGIMAKADDRKLAPCKGLAVWIEPIQNPGQ